MDDALTNYISAINFPDISNDKFKISGLQLHIIGKDILRFHAVYWPAFLLAAKLPLPKEYLVTDGFYQVKKMSKSLGNILDPLEIIKKYGID